MSWLDSAYFQGKFIIKLANIDNFKSFLAEEKVEYQNSLKGYLYLIETSVNTLIHSIEFLIQDQKLYDLVHWGDITSKQIIKEVKIKSKDVQFINGLESLRDKLKEIRIGKSKKEPKEYLIILTKKCEDITSYYLKNLKYEINKTNQSKEDLFFLFDLLNNQNHFEGDVKFNVGNEVQESTVIPLYPAGSWYYQMSGKTSSDNHLQNPTIKQYEKEYVNGYKLGLIFIYKYISITKEFLEKLRNSENWEGIHHVGARIADKLFEDKSTQFIGNKIFDVKYDMRFKKNDLKNIKDPKQLIYVFGNRGVKVHNYDTSYNPFENHFAAEPILYSLIKSNINSEDKTEIIEFIVKDKYGERKYSYAVYVFYAGTIWNGSYWLLFKDIAIENDWETESDTKMFIRGIIKRFKSSFKYQKYEVDEKIFERYIRENDNEYSKKIKEYNIIKNSNSLLIELIAVYYHLKYANKKILWLDWGFELEKNHTEVDSLIVLEDEIIITQAKYSLNKPLSKISEHFQNIENLLPSYLKKKNINTQGKKIRNTLFLFSKELSEEQLREVDNFKGKFEIIFLEDFIEGNKEFMEEKLLNKIYDCVYPDW